MDDRSRRHGHDIDRSGGRCLGQWRSLAGPNQPGDADQVAPCDGGFVVSVEDYGPGLPDGASERVFAKLQRGSLEGARGGVGLGLAICRSIVVLHGGRVWAEQLDGGGSAFRFTLPVEEAPQVPAEAAA